MRVLGLVQIMVAEVRSARSMMTVLPWVGKVPAVMGIGEVALILMPYT
jgi:hypothetical protein